MFRATHFLFSLKYINVEAFFCYFFSNSGGYEWCDTPRIALESGGCTVQGVPYWIPWLF